MTSPKTMTFALTELGKRAKVTIESPDGQFDEGLLRESGMAVRRPVQLLRIDPYEKMCGGLLALYDDGSVWECLDGSTVWDEVEMPR